MKDKQLRKTILLTALTTTLALSLLLFALVGAEGLALIETMAVVRTRFVGETQEDQVIDSALSGLVSGLGDRWSYYLDADYYESRKLSKDNAYVGIGCTTQQYGDLGLLVIAVTPDSGAEEAGLVVDDVILAFDGIPMEGEARNNLSDYAHGEEGTQVELLVQGQDGTQRTLVVTRKRVLTSPVSSQLLEDGTAVVTIQNFNARCAEDTMAAVNDLIDQGAQRLVFDVRNNGGGYVDEMTALLDDLLPKGIIFRTEGKFGLSTTVTSDDACIDLPIAVLVNDSTYSAAEFFAAQIQEMDRGIIVGEPTSGKGYSQQTFPLPTGGAVGISTARYRTGEGVSLVGVGVSLDAQVELDERQRAQLNVGALDPGEDPQLQAAIALLNPA